MLPRLEAAYAEPHRRYHTLEHVQDCLAQLARVEGLSAQDRRVLEYAIWWHDAVYDPTRHDNEARSAELAERDLERLGEPEAVRAEVARLVRLTAGHVVEPGDPLGGILVSIDLSIFGARAAAYDRYAAAIREEYGFVPDEAFRAGRAAVLRKFLDAPVIYPDERFRARLEVQARENLARELATLA